MIVCFYFLVKGGPLGGCVLSTQHHVFVSVYTVFFFSWVVVYVKHDNIRDRGIISCCCWCSMYVSSIVFVRAKKMCSVIFVWIVVFDFSV